MVCHCWRVRGDEVGGRRFFFAFSNALQTFGSCSVLLFMILHSISQFTGTFRSGGVSGVYFRGVGEVSFCTIKKYEFEFVVLSQGLRRGSQKDKSLYIVLKMVGFGEGPVHITPTRLEVTYTVQSIIVICFINQRRGA